MSLAVISPATVSRVLSPVHGDLEFDQSWYPSGPSMDHLWFSMYSDQLTEFNGFPQNLDFTDTPLTALQIQSYQSAYTISEKAAQGAVSGLDFNMANHYWGCYFIQYGLSPPPCAVDIRQGIAHLIDKVLYSINIGYVQAVPTDDPVGVALTPDPCLWDTSSPQTGSTCQVNGPAGTAYHLAAASNCGIPSCPSKPTFQWTPGLGTPDFCAAAKHFVKAGIASDFDHHTCQLTGLSSQITTQPVHVFERLDNLPLLRLGQSIVEGICALFTGSFSTGCSINGKAVVIVDNNATNSFPGFHDSQGVTNVSWWIYTSGGGSYAPANIFGPERLGPVAKPGTTKLDYSEFVKSMYDMITTNGSPVPNSSCAGNAFSSTPANYGYICDQAYDSLVAQIASAPCESAPGDPTTGQTASTVTFANCSGTTQLTAASALYKAEDRYGQEVNTIPVFVVQNQYVYPTSWSASAGGRVVNSYAGTFGYFNWLDAYNPHPAQTGYIRQAFSQSTSSLNPYAAASPWDFAVLSAIYDSLQIRNPADPTQSIDWMDKGVTVIPNSQIGYALPAGTVATYRYQLRNDLFWHDQTHVTAWDVKFSYSTLASLKVQAGTALQSMVCNTPTCIDGVSVISQSQVDIHVTQNSPLILNLISSIPILPGRYWTNANCYDNVWVSDTTKAQFNSTNVPDLCMTVGNISSTYAALNVCSSDKASMTDPCYDPLQDVRQSPPRTGPYIGNLVGSGPWICQSSGVIYGGGCSSTGTENPPNGGAITLSRNGLGTFPGASYATYFRSNGNLALWIWSQDTGDFNHDGQLFSIAASCVGLTPVPAKCAQWGMGIGNPGGTSSSLATVTSTQISILFRFQGVNWVSPLDWRALPPQNIGTFPPVLYDDLAPANTPALSPSSAVGCAVSYSSGGGYDC